MKQDLEIIFAGLEQYVEVIADNEIYVFDFLGFTSDWDEIMQDIPDFVRKRFHFVKQCSTRRLIGRRGTYNSRPF